MKSKFKIKILFFILTLLFLMLTIFLIRSTYARYITSLTAKSSVELGSWLIEVNNQNIIQDSDISEIVTPIFNENSEYIAQGKISPTSTGYVEIKLDYSEVTVPFKYEISFEHDDATVLEDFKLTSYSIDNGALTNVDANGIIQDTIAPDETLRTRTLILNLSWLDGTGEVLNNTQDTAFSRNFEEIGLRFNISFVQLQPTI